MPRRADIQKILVLGSGPIVIGQACEFDYSGTQACKALRQAGYEVILVNSNPATIMTDPDTADQVYVEPLRWEYVREVIACERPQALIPTLGGQTALNLALELNERGVLAEFGVELLGASIDAIERAENRELFRSILDEVGAKYPNSVLVKDFAQGLRVAEEMGYPLVLRPNFTLGGGGGGIAYTPDEYQVQLARALAASPSHEVLVEASILGWKEFELEVMRDQRGTFVVVCSIENFDPCGVHTGDSITVAPQQTLSDREYQLMRLEAKAIIEAVGVATGGANIQFAVHPETGERVVIEMNPRVSRSSALASKATGFPIAKIAALLAVGFYLDEITNDITGTTPACFEPALDYVVTKIPYFNFEKFPGTRDELGTQMKSVGEVMAIGRTFRESLQKAALGMERYDEAFPVIPLDTELVARPNSQRLWHLVQAMREGKTIADLFESTQISYWFLEQLQILVDMENQCQSRPLDATWLRELKENGFADNSICRLYQITKSQVRELRAQWDIHPGFFRVDTCAGEFASATPYYYSSYWGRGEVSVTSSNQRILVIGSGPNRIGQGIEFDYSCVRGIRYLKSLGFQVALINSNPETVSTDYDTADELFFEPLTDEHVLAVLDFIGPRGFIAQLGGQTPIQLSPTLVAAGHHLLGSTLVTVDLAEDRGRFSDLCRELEVRIPQSGMASTLDEARRLANQIGFPMICRPSYVLGGRRMEIVESDQDLVSYFHRHSVAISVGNPCLMDQFLDRAIEVDVDLVAGPGWQIVGGVMEHIERAGVHSGDSMGVIPPQRLKPDTVASIEMVSKKLAERLGVMGFLNLQLAIREDEIFMIEANPRSSRSLPFLAKASNAPLVNWGVWGILGEKRPPQAALDFDWRHSGVVCVKGVAFPFNKFRDADSILGPEMKSTGEVMGRSHDYAEALVKALLSTYRELPQSGEIFLSLRDKDKSELIKQIRLLSGMGFSFSATRGTADFLNDQGILCESVLKVHEGRPNCVDRIRSGQVKCVFNTTSGRTAIEASVDIRRSCVDQLVPCITESDAIKAFVIALRRSQDNILRVRALPREAHLPISDGFASLDL